MLRIRLSRTGAKKQPSYRVVVANSESKRDGRIVERIGHYNPRREPLEYLIDEDRALYWLSVGAQPSDPVRRLLDKQGTFDRLTRMRQGESRETLVSEFLGVAPTEQPEDVEAVAEPEIEAAEVEEAVVAAVVEEIEEVVAIEEEE